MVNLNKKYNLSYFLLPRLDRYRSTGRFTSPVANCGLKLDHAAAG